MLAPPWRLAALMLVSFAEVQAHGATDSSHADGLPSAVGNHADESEPTFELADEHVVPDWSPNFDLRARRDQVSNLPAGRADLERTQLRMRLGSTWHQGEMLSVGLGMLTSLSSHPNRDNVRNNDNDRGDHIGIDQAWLKWRPIDNSQLVLGKASLPLALTPLVWDADLRPAGASWSYSREMDGFDRWQWNVGAFEVDHPLANGPHLLAAQLGWHWREGAPTSMSAVAGYLAFEQLEPLLEAGLGRGNPVSDGHYTNEYRLLDMQLAVRRQANGGGWPVEARLDLVRNLAAERSNDAARFSLTWGEVNRMNGWEVGFAYQRIQSAAVLAAVNSDDWWFHTGSRGSSLSVAYGISGDWSLRMSGFSETKDGVEQATGRLLVDVSAHW